MPGDRREQLEPRRSADDFIDDLPTREYACGQSASIGHAVSDVDTQPIKRVAIRPATVLGLVLLVATWTCGWATAAMQYVTGDRRDESSQASSPDPAPTETVTKTVTRLPESCERALRDFAKYLDAASAVSSMGGRQMDILDRAFQAILSKDWKALNQLREDQRRLESDMLPASSKVIPELKDVQEEMIQCQSDAG